MRAHGRGKLGGGRWGRMAESQLSELRNMRVLLEEARLRAQDLAYLGGRDWKPFSGRRWTRWIVR